MKKIFILSILLLFISVLTGCNPERSSGYSQEITKNDVKVEKFSNSLYFAFIIRPQVSVDDLSVTIGFYDKNDYPVGARTKQIGKVIAGQEYHIEFNNNDFTTTELSVISKFKYLDAEGTLWLDQETHGLCFEHKYDSGYITREPHCDCLGERMYTCLTCGYKKNELISRIEHNWVENKYSDMKYICTKCLSRCNWMD